MARVTRRAWPGLLLALMLSALFGAGACRSGVEEAPGFVPDEQRSVRSEDAGVQFVDVTSEAGIVFGHFNDVRTSVLIEDMGSGAAWGDYDDDGLVDLFIVNSSRDEQGQRPMDRGKLFRNLGDGSFEDVTESSGIRQTGLGMGAVWFDHDGDGDLDLFTTGFGWQKLYSNKGGGSFEDVTVQSGLSIDGGWPAGSTVADYDLDGDLDLYVPQYVAFQHDSGESATLLNSQYGLDTPFTLNPFSYDPLANRLYRNDGDGTFADVAASARVADPEGRSLQAVFADLNSDGLPDLYVANDISPDALFINNGDGTFENVAEYARTADARGSMGIAVGDYDGDLDPDLWITHWIAQDDALFRNMSDQSVDDEIRFIDRIASDVGESSLSYVGWGVGFVDYDNDGRLDVFVVNGSTFEPPEDKTKLAAMRNLLFRNRGEEGFVLVNDVAGDVWATKDVGRGASFADYDNDGDLDILIVARGEGVKLLQNQGGATAKWLVLDLKGGAGNRQAIGATVTISASGAKQQMTVVAGSSYLSMNDTRLHFGLGEDEIVDSVEIRWPDGHLQTLNGVNANQILTVSKEQQ